MNTETADSDSLCVKGVDQLGYPANNRALDPAQFIECDRLRDSEARRSKGPIARQSHPQSRNRDLADGS
jgi:hypothetical protein